LHLSKREKIISTMKDFFEKQEDKIAPLRFAPFRNFPNQSSPFCAAIIQGLGNKPPGVLPVGSGARRSNPHARLAPALTDKG